MIGKYGMSYKDNPREYQRIWYRIHREADPEKYREIDRQKRIKYWKHKRELDRKRYQLHKLKKIWKPTKEQAAAKYQRRKEKYRAGTILLRAIKKGIIVRGNKCETCGKIGFMEGHHDDYTKPLRVRWLCIACHRLHHYPPPTERINNEK